MSQSDGLTPFDGNGELHTRSQDLAEKKQICQQSAQPGEFACDYGQVRLRYPAQSHGTLGLSAYAGAAKLFCELEW